MRRRALAACCLPWLFACAAAPDAGLAGEVQAITDLPVYRAAHWGILVVDLATGGVLLEQNADKLFAPASTTKLYSVAAAWQEFGPDHRFATPIVRRGDVDAAGVLHGDLILVAAGDLTLDGRTDENGEIAYSNGDHTYANGNTTARLTAPDPLQGLARLALAVAAAGIRRVEGDVLVDDRLFEHATATGSGPGRVTPAIVNDNLVDLLVVPAVAGQPAAIRVRPQSDWTQVDAQVATVADGEADVTVSGASGRITLRGTIPERHAPLVRVHEVADPAAFLRHLLVAQLGAAGVAVAEAGERRNRADRLPAPAETARLPVVAALQSPPFAEHARLILKVSHNLHASALPLLLAARHGKRTLAEGLQLQAARLRELGIDPLTVAFGGGAGGARVDLTTPRTTVALLAALAHRADFARFERALPVLGVDGTLATAVGADSPARGRVRAKTGTYFLSDPLNGSFVLTSKALAGYLEASSGRRCAFMLVVNGARLQKPGETDRFGKDLARICEVLVRRL